MTTIKDLFIPENPVITITDGEYQKLDVLINAFDAISAITYQSLYIIDYFKKNFLFVSDNPLFLCGHTVEEVKKMGGLFYLNNIPPDEQEMITEINRTGFDFFDKMPVEERSNFAISYDFNLLSGKKKTLVNHTFTPLLLTIEGNIRLAACVISLSSHCKPGYAKIRNINQSTFLRYLPETRSWKEETGIILNEREKDILTLSAQGFTMNEIAKRLFIAPDTVKFHKRKLFEKLNVKNITEAFAFALNHKLL